MATKGTEDALEIATTCGKCGSVVTVRVMLAAAHSSTRSIADNGGPRMNALGLQTEDLLRELKARGAESVQWTSGLEEKLR